MSELEFINPDKAWLVTFNLYSGCFFNKSPLLCYVLGPAPPLKFIVKRIGILIDTICSVCIYCSSLLSRVLSSRWQQSLCTICLFTRSVLEYTKWWIWSVAGQVYQYAHVAWRERFVLLHLAPIGKSSLNWGSHSLLLVRTSGSLEPELMRLIFF